MINKYLFEDKTKIFSELELLISNGDYETAKSRIAALILDEKPRNRYYLLLARIFFFEGDYKKAEENLINLYKDGYDKALVELINLYTTTQEYDKAYYLLDDVNKSYIIDENKKDLLNSIILKGMGMETKPRSKGYSYQSKQVIDFDEADALVYITKKNKKGSNKNFVLFNSNKEIIEIHSLVKQALDYASPLPKTGCFDNYIFKYENSGINGDNEISNYVKATVIKNTKNIISIFPCFEGSKTECIDLRNINNDLEKTKNRNRKIQTKI